MHRKSVLISNIHFHILRSFERILAKSLIYTKKVVINRYGNNVPVRCILKRHVALWFQVEMFPLLAILQLSGMMHCIRHKCVILSTIGHRYVKFSLKKNMGNNLCNFIIKSIKNFSSWIFVMISSVLMLIFVFLDNMAEAVHKPAGIEELQGRIHWNTFTIFLYVLHNAIYEILCFVIFFLTRVHSPSNHT